MTDTIYQSKIRLPQALDISELVAQAKERGYVSGDSLNVRVSYPEYFWQIPLRLDGGLQKR